MGGEGRRGGREGKIFGPPTTICLAQSARPLVLEIPLSDGGLCAGDGLQRSWATAASEKMFDDEGASRSSQAHHAGHVGSKRAVADGHDAPLLLGCSAGDTIHTTSYSRSANLQYYRLIYELAHP